MKTIKTVFFTFLEIMLCMAIALSVLGPAAYVGHLKDTGQWKEECCCKTFIAQERGVNK